MRDAILEDSSINFENASNIEDATIVAENSLEHLKSTAERVVNEAGFNYAVSVEIDEVYFDTRVYDTFTLPAGVYEAVCIKIGEAKGKNWWCVMYPTICIPAASGRLTDSVSSSTAKIAENPNRYIIRFKTVEIFEQIKKFFKNIK